MFFPLPSPESHHHLRTGKKPEVDIEPITFKVFEGNLISRRQVAVDRAPVHVLSARIRPVERVVPIRLLVTSPLGMVRVSLSPGLEVILAGDRVSVLSLLKIRTLVDPILNVIGLASNRVAQNLICFENLLESAFSFPFLGIRSHCLEIRVVDLGQLVVSQLDFLLTGGPFYIKDLVECLVLFAHVEKKGEVAFVVELHFVFTNLAWI